MLTTQQLLDLDPLCQHPKFGKLLKDAIEIWKVSDISPMPRHFGIDTKSNTYILDYLRQCCIIGACVVNKPSNISIFETIRNNYNIEGKEYDCIISGFENYTHSTENKQAYEFGKNVRKALFGAFGSA